MFKRFLSTFLMILLIGQANVLFARNDDAEDKAAEIREQAAELLRETSSLAVMLSSPSNRINFTVSTADSLWSLDKKEAISMFSVALEDVRKMISQIDAEMNFAASTNSNDRRKNSVKINQVLSWRTSVVNNLSNRDPEWALRFVNETDGIVTNPEFRRRIDRSTKGLNAILARKIAEQDVTKALEFGREKLSKGISNDVVNLLQKVYVKDAEKAIKFGEEVLKKLDTTNLNRNSTWMIVKLFQNGLNSSKNTNSPPLFSDSSMRKLAAKLAGEITKPTSRYRNLSPQIMDGLEKYAPQSVEQVKIVFEQRTASRNNTRSTVKSNSINSANISRQNSNNIQSDVNTGFKNIGSREISTEEKVKIIDDLQNKIMSGGSDGWRFTNLIRLANSANSIGADKKALQLLGEAERFINQDPKVKMEFADNRNLANAYAKIDPDKTFQILENMAYRLNEVINGYIKFMEYSGNQRVVENGELIMNNHSRQFTTYFNLSSNALQSLAEEDFSRVKDLSDKFERPEVRIATRLMIARALLNSSQISPGITRQSVVKSQIQSRIL